MFSTFKIPQNHRMKKDPNKIIDNLQMFLLELGKGFAFVAKQFPLIMNMTKVR